MSRVAPSAIPASVIGSPASDGPPPPPPAPARGVCARRHGIGWSRDVGIGGEAPLQQPGGADAVHQGVVDLGVDREPVALQPLDEVALPQRPVVGQLGGVQPAHQRQQLADPAGLGQRGVPHVVLEVHLVVGDPGPLPQRRQRAVRPLAERGGDLGVGDRPLVEVPQPPLAGVVGVGRRPAGRRRASAGPSTRARGTSSRSAPSAAWRRRYGAARLPPVTPVTAAAPGVTVRPRPGAGWNRPRAAPPHLPHPDRGGSPCAAPAPPPARRRAARRSAPAAAASRLVRVRGRRSRTGRPPRLRATESSPRRRAGGPPLPAAGTGVGRPGGSR